LTNLVKATYLARMKQVSLYEAKTHLSKLVDEASAGEEIVIAKNGKPLARLLPLSAPEKREPRKLGQWAEQNKHIDWDKWDRDFKALDKEIEADFEASIAKPFPGMSESAGPSLAPASAKRSKKPAPRTSNRKRKGR
jgi:prevent-host-death family protein